jgi:hypothetical protein
MVKTSERKKELDRERTEWRKTHRSLGGKVILYPKKQPEHVNARGNKTYNWFWKKILLPINMHDIPALISMMKQRINREDDKRKIRKFRTMIGMANDAYQLKQLEDISEYDSDLQMGTDAALNNTKGLLYQGGKMYSTELNEQEDTILIRDMEGIIVDIHYGNNGSEVSQDQQQSTNASIYKDWNYHSES